MSLLLLFGGSVPNPNDVRVRVGSDASIGATAFAVALTLGSVSSAAALGTPTIRVDCTLTLSSVSSAASLGTVTPQCDYTGTLTAVTSTASLGTLTVDIGGSSPNDVLVRVGTDATITGQPMNQTVALSSVTSPGLLGTLTERVDYSRTETAVSSLAALGTLGVRVDQTLTLTAVTSAATLGTIAVRGDVAPTLTGQTSSAQLGTLAVVIDHAETLSSVTSPGILGTLSTSATTASHDVLVQVGADASVTGMPLNQTITLAAVSSPATLGSLSPRVDCTLVLTSVSSPALTGTLTVELGNLTVDLPAVTSAAATGTLGIQVDHTRNLSAVTSSGATGTLLVDQPRHDVVLQVGITASLQAPSSVIDVTLTLADVTSGATLGTLNATGLSDNDVRIVVGPTAAIHSSSGTVTQDVLLFLTGVSSGATTGTLNTDAATSHDVHIMVGWQASIQLGENVGTAVDLVGVSSGAVVGTLAPTQDVTLTLPSVVAITILAFVVRVDAEEFLTPATSSATLGTLDASAPSVSVSLTLPSVQSGAQLGALELVLPESITLTLPSVVSAAMLGGLILPDYVDVYLVGVSSSAQVGTLKVKSKKTKRVALSPGIRYSKATQSFVNDEEGEAEE